ncbi:MULTISPECIES: DUF397 domain-containing protein [unclassified Streptomyces]|uniref:DUF397 domain-containing protein n=1 Tax=unclassified Streptomyces TaxID=2593676 RepID=UPI00278BEB6D|nr:MULTISPECIES: DUF397 domain-containing protein [unclassified Streptomyces]
MTIRPPADGAAGLEWFKSSYSSNEGPECVEVATTPRTAHVRDSKNALGARLAFGAEGWSAFVSYVGEVR